MQPFLRLSIFAASFFALRMAAAEKETFSKPSFCHGLDCPIYTVVEKTSDYEVRKYAASKWVSTTIDGVHFVEAQRRGFDRLFDYISGDNEDSKKIPMTAPVRSFITAGDGPFCATKFTVSFFVPYDYWKSTPNPSAKEVFIEETPEMTVYVTSFGGYMREDDVIQHAATLQEILKKKGISVVSENYYACGYDSPFRILGRHNEIWLVSEQKGQQREELEF